MRIASNPLQKITFKLFFVVLFFLATCIGKKEAIDNLASPDAISIQKITEPIDALIENEMKTSGIVGLGAAIIVNKELVWINGYGYADKENKTPFTENTIMNIASISKTFTGASIVHAVEDGYVSLDEDINTYLPFKLVNPFLPNEKITLRNIATHTSGLADDYDVYDKTYYYGNDPPEALGEFLKNYFLKGGKYYSKKNFLNKKPGTYRDYSNIAAGLAGYIIELETGKPLNEYSEQHFFKPLKMNDTGWLLSEVDLNNHSKQYEKQGDTLKTIPFFQLTTYPDGGVRTSVNDLSKFFISLLNNGEYNDVKILNGETARELTRFQFTTLNKPENIDLENPNKNSGIFWATKRDVTLIGHAGSDHGVQTEMFSNLSKDLGIILFSNTSGVNTLNIFDILWEHSELIKKTKSLNYD